MEFKDAMGNALNVGDTVLTPGFFLATVKEHDPNIYGTDKPMVMIHNSPRDLIFYPAEELCRVKITAGGTVKLVAHRGRLERPAFE